jgi:hypothetical protein
MGTGCVPEGLRGRLLLYGATNVDHIVGDDAEAYPSLHSNEAFVVGSAEAVPSLDHADASLGSSAPLLAIPEPSLSLFAFSVSALGRAIGNADAFDPLRLRRSLVLRGVKCRVGGD